MSDLYDKIVSERGSLGNLAARIPGFRGYQDKRDRRAADRMLRDAIADQLAQRVNRLNTLEKRLLQSGGMSYMSATREAKTKLQTYTDRVKTAAPGYSGFFATEKIGDEELERLYAFDEAQLRAIDTIDAALDTLEGAVDAGEEIEQAVRGVYDAAAQANDAYALRDQVLNEIDSQYS